MARPAFTRNAGADVPAACAERRGMANTAAGAGFEKRKCFEHETQKATARAVAGEEREGTAQGGEEDTEEGKGEAANGAAVSALVSALVSV